MLKIIMIISAMLHTFIVMSMDVLGNNMGAALNYADVFQRGLGGQKFTVGVRFSALYDAAGTSTNQFKYIDGKTIKIPVLTVTGMVDTTRDTIGTATRKVDNAWETKTLSHDRTFRTLVDPADIDETNMAVSIGNITSVFVNEELFPEMDKYMASKLFTEVTAYGTINNDAVATAANVLAVFDKFMTALDESEVPEEGRYLYVTPAINALLKEALNNSRQLGTAQAGNDVSRIINMIDDVKRVTVPSSRMKEAYVFTVGAVPAAGADQINMILVHPKAVIAPIKIDQILIDEPSALSDGKALYFQRQYWDAFLLEQKAAGCQINATVVA